MTIKETVLRSPLPFFPSSFLTFFLFVLSILPRTKEGLRWGIEWKVLYPLRITTLLRYLKDAPGSSPAWERSSHYRGTFPNGCLVLPEAVGGGPFFRHPQRFLWWCNAFPAIIPVKVNQRIQVHLTIRPRCLGLLNKAGQRCLKSWCMTSLSKGCKPSPSSSPADSRS